MLHDVPGVDGDVPKATFLREMMSGEFGSELGPREGRSEHRGRDMPDGAHFFVYKKMHFGKRRAKPRGDALPLGARSINLVYTCRDV